MTMSLDEKQSQITGTHESEDDLHNKRTTLNRNETKYNERSEHKEKENEADGIYEVCIRVCMYIACRYSTVCTFRSCIGVEHERLAAKNTHNAVVVFRSLCA